MGATHGQVPGVDDVFQCECAGAGGAAPGVAVGLVDGNRFAAAVGLYGFYLPREVPDQIAAGYPGRQGKCLPVGVGLSYGQGDFEAMAGWIKRRYAVQ